MKKIFSIYNSSIQTNKFYVVRYNIDGSLVNTSFNASNGYKICFDGTSSKYPKASAIQSNSEILQVG